MEYEQSDHARFRLNTGNPSVNAIEPVREREIRRSIVTRSAGFIGLLQPSPRFVRRIFLIVKLFFQGSSRRISRDQDRCRAVSCFSLKVDKHSIAV